MPETAVRLLFTCRDPNGAHQIAPLAEAAYRRDRLSVTLLADGYGFEWLRAAGLPVVEAKVPVVGHGDTAGRSEALRRARALLAEYGPDAVVSCYSGPKSGVDEAMIAVASPSITFLLQDFWGDINPGFDRLPGTAFVLDRAAEALTVSRYPVRTVVTGMPKFEAYAGFDVSAMRAGARQALAVEGSTSVIGFFGQPLWDEAAYRKSVEAFGAAVRDFGKAALLLRPHPRDKTGEMDRLADSLTDGGVAVRIACRERFERIEDVLAACDIACSAFSSACHDMIVLNRVALAPAGRALYYLPEEMHRVYREQVVHGALPPVDAGLALLARDPAELRDAFARALAPEPRAEAWRHIRASSPPVAGASDRILDAVLASIPDRARAA